MPNNPSNELELVPASPMPVTQQSANLPVQANIGGMLQAVIQQGVTKDNVAALESLVKLYEHTCALDAEREFAKAFNALQTEMPNIQAIREVPDKQGNLKYKYAPYEDIMKQVRPLLLKHGFSISFSQRFDAARIISVCKLTHSGGHSRENEFAVRTGAGPYGATETQADGAAGTYAKRFALCNALNIVCEHDTDARAEGGFITPDQAKDLQARVLATGSNEEFFLKYAGAKDYSEIRAGKYAALDASLRKKENTTRR